MSKAHEPKVKFDTTSTMIIAHRGLTSRHLENTLLALTEAFDIGVDGVEFDVQLSRDLVPMVFHDRSLGRLTDINKNIDDLSFAELVRLEQKRAPYTKAYPIASLEQVLNAMPQGKLINVEVKETVALKGPQGIASVLRVLKAYKHNLKLVISSFDPKILMRINEGDADYSLGYLMDKNHVLFSYLNSVRILNKIDYLHPHIDLVTPTVSRWVRKHDIRLIMWGHTAMGQESAFMHDNHTALISDIPKQLIEKYKRVSSKFC